MGRVAKALGPLEVKRLKGIGYHAVGTVPGLYLQISSQHAKSWILRTMVGNKRKEIGLGPYPAITLQMAHEAARDKYQQIRGGADPIEAARAARSALKAAQAKAVTFEQCAAAYISAHESSWTNSKHGQQWKNTLDVYANPLIGSLLVRDVTTDHVLAILEPIWRTKTETAVRLKGRIERILDWATTRQYREGLNPARWKGHLDTLLPPPSKVAKSKHHAALPYVDAPRFMARLREIEGVSARALEYALLTVVRSEEARGAMWGEVDFEKALWTIPAERMKAKKQHVVPLSDAALTLLRNMPRHAGTDLIFPSSRGTGKLSDMALLMVMRRMEVNAVPHGLRSTFRDWCSEATGHLPHVAEMALAHVIGNKVEAAYRRGELLEKRRELMSDWARYLG